ASSRARSSAATWRMRDASASDEPPNLCATLRAGATTAAAVRTGIEGSRSSVFIVPPGEAPHSLDRVCARILVEVRGREFETRYSRTADRTTVIVDVVVVVVAAKCR